MEEISEFFKALGDPLRLRILQMLPDRECDCAVRNVSELAQALGVPQPTVSHHLRTLKHAGIVRCRKMCRDAYYWIDRDVLRQRMEALEGQIIPRHEEGPAEGG